MLTQGMEPVVWLEIAFLVFAVVAIGLNAVILVWALKHAKLDNLECNKFVVFTQDPFPRDLPEPKPPLYCELHYPQEHSFWRGLIHPKFGTNTRWVGFVFLIWLAWLTMVFLAFFNTHVHPLG
jgi:hypothetical protein